MQSPRLYVPQIKPKSSAIRIILATLLIPVPIRSSAEAHSALNIVRDRGLWQWAVVATTVVAFKMASALRKHLWRGGLLPPQWPPLFVLDRAKLGTQKLTQWHRIDVHLWYFISYGVKLMGLKDMSYALRNVNLGILLGCSLNLRKIIFSICCASNYSSLFCICLYFFKLCTSIRCLKVRKKGCMAWQPFQENLPSPSSIPTPTQEEGLCMLFKGRTPWSDNACSC